jgi:hypothetical protein
MSYLAATLLLYMQSPFECFICFANLLNGYFFLDMYRLNRDMIDLHLDTYDHFFSSRLHSLYSHFQSEGVKSDMYYFEWSLTAFVKCVPLDICARIWDSYLLLGEAFFISAALGILHLYSEALSKMELEKILCFLQHLPQEMDESRLFAAIEEVAISPASFERAKRQIKHPLVPASSSGSKFDCSPS